MHFLTGIAHVNHWKAYLEIEVFAYLRVQWHNVYILNGLSVSCLVAEPHGLGMAHVESVSSVQRICCTTGRKLNSGWSAKIPLSKSHFD